MTHKPTNKQQQQQQQQINPDTVNGRKKLNEQINKDNNNSNNYKRIVIKQNKRKKDSETDRQTDRQTETKGQRQTDRQADRQIDTQTETERQKQRQTETEIETNRPTDRLAGRQTDRRTDGWTDRQTDRQRVGLCIHTSRDNTTVSLPATWPNGNMAEVSRPAATTTFVTTLHSIAASRRWRLQEQPYTNSTHFTVPISISPSKMSGIYSKLSKQGSRPPKTSWTYKSHHLIYKDGTFWPPKKHGYGPNRPRWPRHCRICRSRSQRRVFSPSRPVAHHWKSRLTRSAHFLALYVARGHTRRLISLGVTSALRCTRKIWFRGAGLFRLHFRRRCPVRSVQTSLSVTTYNFQKKKIGNHLSSKFTMPSGDKIVAKLSFWF